MAVNFTPASELLPVEGIRLSAAAAGIRYKNRDDLLLIEIEEGSSVAGVFTQKRFCAAPVLICREHLKLQVPRYLVINSGNANAGTGEKGLSSAREICESLAQMTEATSEQVLPFSTGVIGEQLSVAPFSKAFPEAITNLSEDNWMSAARAIMTTDTLPKALSKQIAIGGKQITLTGIAKGAGMIEPNMATMLAYVGTDAAIAPDHLQAMLKLAADLSFNSITVDGDTSTNDALMLIATGKSGVALESSGDLKLFQEALNELCQYLAQAIIRDAEGATKFVTLCVKNAPDLDTARAVAFTVARSPLVKTALFASDPNWGRILAAIGRSPVKKLDISKLSLWLGETHLIQAGQPVETYTEQAGQLEMNNQEITILIDLNDGEATTTVWTSDLSHDYVTINAEYRS